MRIAATRPPSPHQVSLILKRFIRISEPWQAGMMSPITFIRLRYMVVRLAIAVANSFFRSFVSLSELAE